MKLSIGGDHFAVSASGTNSNIQVKFLRISCNYSSVLFQAQSQNSWLQPLTKVRGKVETLEIGFWRKLPLAIN